MKSKYANISYFDNNKYEKTSWTVAYKTEWVYSTNILILQSCNVFKCKIIYFQIVYIFFLKKSEANIFLEEKYIMW